MNWDLNLNNVTYYLFVFDQLIFVVQFSLIFHFVFVDIEVFLVVDIVVIVLDATVTYDSVLEVVPCRTYAVLVRAWHSQK